MEWREMTAHEVFLQSLADVLADIESMPDDVQLDVLAHLQSYVDDRKETLTANAQSKPPAESGSA